MIDIVFLLLIFFLVCSTMGKNSVVQLPKAIYGIAVNPKTATILTIAGIESDSVVYIGDGTTGLELPADEKIQQEEIVAAVEDGLKQGKTDVVIRADKKLHHGEVVRIETIAASVPGITLYVVVDDH